MADVREKEGGIGDSGQVLIEQWGGTIPKDRAHRRRRLWEGSDKDSGFGFVGEIPVGHANSIART